MTSRAHILSVRQKIRCANSFSCTQVPGGRDSCPFLKSGSSLRGRPGSTSSLGQRSLPKHRDRGRRHSALRRSSPRSMTESADFFLCHADDCFFEVLPPFERFPLQQLLSFRHVCNHGPAERGFGELYLAL